MKKDPIVAELHKIREERARRFNYDLDDMFEDLRRKQARRCFSLRAGGGVPLLSA